MKALRGHGVVAWALHGLNHFYNQPFIYTPLPCVGRGLQLTLPVDQPYACLINPLRDCNIFVFLN
jgi:hypothetical protein